VSEYLFLSVTLRFVINLVEQDQNIAEGFCDHSNELSDGKHYRKRFALLPYHRFAHGKIMRHRVGA
jgi:hypothetical protein